MNETEEEYGDIPSKPSFMLSPQKKTEEDFSCPHCGNGFGFVFGVCIRCGYNHITSQFDWVEVRTDDLPEEVADELIYRHSVRTRKDPRKGDG